MCGSLALLLAAAGKVTDSEAAWKLADMSKGLVEDDGTVKGMDEVIAVVVKQYPYLQTEDPGSVGDDEKVLRERFPALEPSGRPMNARHQGDNPVSTWRVWSANSRPSERKSATVRVGHLRSK